jgi:hypothetical protein
MGWLRRTPQPAPLNRDDVRRIVREEMTDREFSRGVDAHIAALKDMGLHLSCGNPFQVGPPYTVEILKGDLVIAKGTHGTDRRKAINEAYYEAKRVLSVSESLCQKSKDGSV